MMRQWILIALVMALALGSCLSMPVMAEQMIEGSVDKVVTEGVAEEQQPRGQQSMETDGYGLTEEQVMERRKAALTTNAAAIEEVPLSDDAKQALEAAARQAVFEKLGMTVLPEYEPLDIKAYEEDGDTRCVVSLMPQNWELATDALARDETVIEVSGAPTGEITTEESQVAPGEITYEINGADHDITAEVRMLSGSSPFYTVTFGGVNPQTGGAEVLAVQLFYLYNNSMEEQSREYSDEERRAMTEAAIGYAQNKLGLTPGEVIGSDKLSGSFETGMGFTFALEGGDSVTINVSETGHVNGYSFIPPRG